MNSTTIIIILQHTLNLIDIDRKLRDQITIVEDEIELETEM